MIEALAAVENALAGLSNAILEAIEADGRHPNILWADAAVDRALRDMAAIRRWLEPEARA